MSQHISIVDRKIPHDSHNLYDVTFHSHSIQTLLTSQPSFVSTWISDTLSLSTQRPLLVGLDVEWRPNFSSTSNNPVATLQLCVANRCLIFQILHAPSIPPSLVSFLADAGNTFLGVGVKEDAQKLLEDYKLTVANVVDLRDAAADKYRDHQLKQAGLKTLSSRVLGLEVVKPKWISISRWDNVWLTPPQVQYACVDAFLSYEIGNRLLKP